MPAISHVTFTEENDARPTYACAVAAGLALFIDQVILHSAASHTRTLYVTAVCIFMVAAILGMNCLMSCIWQPIPKERRADGQLTSLRLNESSTDTTSTTSAPMFSSLEKRITSDNEESVDSSQVELRDPIQWSKMALVITCVGIDILLLIKWGH